MSVQLSKGYPCGKKAVIFKKRIERTLWELGEYNTTPPFVGFKLHNMDPVAWFLQIPPNPRYISGVSTVSRPSFLFLRSSIRRSEPDDTPRKTPSRSVTFSTHVEEWRQPPCSVSWSAQVEVFVIPVRESAPNDRDPQCVISGRTPHDDCTARASTTPRRPARCSPTP